MFEREIHVRFSECDGLGHVNNGVYFIYMEEARTDLFTLFNPTLNLQTWNLIVASARCDFLKQVPYGDVIRIYTWISRIGTSSFTVEHALKNRAGEWVARGQAAMIAFDYETQQSKPLWPEIKTVLESHGTPPDGAPPLRNG